MAFDKYFAEQLRQCVKKKLGPNFTYKEASHIIGIPEATLFEILNGHMNPTFDKFEKLMAFTGCELCTDNIDKKLRCKKSPILEKPKEEDHS